jgi:two-component system, OmpR family, response regulator
MEKTRLKILLVDDNINLTKALKLHLELNDFTVDTAADGVLGLAAFQREKYALCLLDVVMPNMGGFELAEEIRSLDPDVPLFFLTASDLKEDILTGYQLGADDYINKPFNSEILLHKIKAVLKRTQAFTEKTPEVTRYEFGKFEFNTKLRELKINGQAHRLSPKESELLRLLCAYRSDYLPRELALKEIWGGDNYFNSRSMDVYLSKLRKYLKEDERVEILNIHGQGFRLTEQASTSE